MKITRYFIERRKLTNLVILFIVLLGAFSMFTLPRQNNPNVDFDVIVISTFYPGSSPEDVEINVTDKIEDELEKVDDIEELSSFSIEGMSAIFVQLDPDSDNSAQVKEDIRRAVDRVSDLPDEISGKPIINEMKSTDFPVMEVAISGDILHESLLRKIARDLEAEIKTIGRVGSVNRIGYRKREVHILANMNELDRNHISFLEMIHAIKSQNIKLSGGSLESAKNEKKIVTFSEFENLIDVKDVIIRSNFSGKRIKISNVAKVVDGYKERQIYSRTNGINSINLVVKRRGTTDVINLSEKIKI